MAYATLAQLANYLNVPQGDLPPNSATMLERASELIDYATLGRIDATDTEQAETAKKATCQQVEYYLAVGETDKTGEIFKSFSIGSFNAQLDEKRGQLNILSPRAKRTLLLAGMLYRGVRLV